MGLSDHLNTIFVVSIIATVVAATVGGYALGGRPMVPADYTGFLAFLLFTGGMFAFGHSLFSTFMRMEMPEWNLFSSGAYFLFAYGIASIAGILFDLPLFHDIASALLVLSLLLMIVSLRRIYEPFRGVR